LFCDNLDEDSSRNPRTVRARLRQLALTDPWCTDTLLLGNPAIVLRVTPVPQRVWLPRVGGNKKTICVNADGFNQYRKSATLIGWLGRAVIATHPHARRVDRPNNLSIIIRRVTIDRGMAIAARLPRRIRTDAPRTEPYRWLLADRTAVVRRLIAHQAGDGIGGQGRAHPCAKAGDRRF